MITTIDGNVQFEGTPTTNKLKIKVNIKNILKCNKKDTKKTLNVKEKPKKLTLVPKADETSALCTIT